MLWKIAFEVWRSQTGQLGRRCDSHFEVNTSMQSLATTRSRQVPYSILRTNSGMAKGSLKPLEGRLKARQKCSGLGLAGRVQNEVGAVDEPADLISLWERRLDDALLISQFF